MSGNNGQKKPLPKFDEKYKDCFLHVALKMIENLTGQDAQICIKVAALESFPDIGKPIFVYDKSKDHWAMINPKKEEPKIATPDIKLILPPGAK